MATFEPVTQLVIGKNCTYRAATRSLTASGESLRPNCLIGTAFPSVGDGAYRWQTGCRNRTARMPTVSTARATISNESWTMRYSSSDR
jgi:hypothetical protein